MKLSIAALFAAILLTLAASVHAYKYKPGPDVQLQRIDALVSELNLDDSKSEQIKALLIDGHDKRRAIMKKSKTELEALRVDQKQKIATILDEEERNRLEAMMREKREKFREKRNQRLDPLASY